MSVQRWRCLKSLGRRLPTTTWTTRIVLTKMALNFFRPKNNLLKIFAAKIGAKFSGCRWLPSAIRRVYFSSWNERTREKKPRQWKTLFRFKVGGVGKSCPSREISRRRRSFRAPTNRTFGSSGTLFLPFSSTSVRLSGPTFLCSFSIPRLVPRRCVALRVCIRNIFASVSFDATTVSLFSLHPRCCFPVVAVVVVVVVVDVVSVVVVVGVTSRSPVSWLSGVPEKRTRSNQEEEEKFRLKLKSRSVQNSAWFKFCSVFFLVEKEQNVQRFFQCVTNF